MKYSKEVAQEIQKHLSEKGIRGVSFDEERGVYEFGMGIPGPLGYIRVIVRVRNDDYSVYAICPISADSENATQMSNMSEFICRANYGLKAGCFEFDFDDGEIRFKSYVDCDELIPSQSVICNSIGISVAMIKRYGKGIINVLFSGMNAEAAVEECENNDERDRSELLSLIAKARRRLTESESAELDGMFNETLSDEEGSSDSSANTEAEYDGIPSFEAFLHILNESSDASDLEDETEEADSTEVAV